MVTLVVLAYAAIGYIEIKSMIRKGQFKELVLYSAIFGIAFILSILLSLGVEIPSIAEPIEKVIKAVIGTE